MINEHNPRPSVPCSSRAPAKGGGQNRDTAEGAKNRWVPTGALWKLTLATFNARKLTVEESLSVILAALSGIKLVNIGLSEVARTGEGFVELISGHGTVDHKRRNTGCDFYPQQKKAENAEVFYTIIRGAATVVTNQNR